MNTEQGSDIVFIRHAQSIFNQATLKKMKQLNIYGSWYQIAKNKQFQQAVTYNIKFSDAPLSELGRQQCLKLNKTLTTQQLTDKKQLPFNPLQVDLVLVSPYLRALQTCSAVFEGSKAHVLVEPLLSQVFRYSCDVPGDIQAKKKLYSDFDFSKVNQLGEYYFLSIFPEKQQKRLQNILKQKNPQTIQDTQKIMMDLISKKDLQQKSQWMRERIWKAKQLLSQHKKAYKKIAIVAHNYTLEFMLSTGFDQNGQLQNQKGIMNCYPYFSNIDELLKIK